MCISVIQQCCQCPQRVCQPLAWTQAEHNSNTSVYSLLSALAVGLVGCEHMVNKRRGGVVGVGAKARALTEAVRLEHDGLLAVVGAALQVLHVAHVLHLRPHAPQLTAKHAGTMPISTEEGRHIWASCTGLIGNAFCIVFPKSVQVHAGWH